MRISDWSSDVCSSDLWLFTILYRQFLDSQRRGRRYARLLEWFAGTDSAAPSAERQALARSSLDAFELLPEAQRTLLWLVGVEGLSYKAVADLLNIPPRSAERRVGREGVITCRT